MPISSIYTHYNAQLVAMAESRIAKGDKLLIVDMENGAGIDYHLQDVGGDFLDVFHLSKSGYIKMANV
ncbi:MAG: hypothetical protein NPIRA05_10520 [Nitrospirales bacterium]|nr:MAG: hypothetical protein NPIRA05_10520 [Nitrospirales bacterium]